MTYTNEAGWDRGVRMLVGFVLLYAAWGVSSPTFAWAILIVALVALVTGTLGWCPAYSLFHSSTRKTGA